MRAQPVEEPAPEPDVWQVVFTRQAQKDSLNLSSAGLRAKAETLLAVLPQGDAILLQERRGFMSIYRVTMKINFLVEINDENAMADPRMTLQGDTAQSALNRVHWIWLKGMQATKQWNKLLGVRRSFAQKRDWEVIRLEDQSIIR